jgi:hypothetical protein
MRPTNLRCPRTARITAGALAIAAPASAVAFTASQADALGALQITPASDHLRYGHALTVRGLAPSSDRGYRLALQFSRRGRPWHTLARTKVRANGAFALRVPLTRSGSVRLVPVRPPAPGRHGGLAAGRNLLSAAAGPAPIAPSPPQPVTVAAKLATAPSALVALPGQPVTVSGTLLPRRPGAVVRLQTRSHHRWRTVATARTRRHGGFTLRHAAHAGGPHTFRVNFAGDAGNTAVSTRGRSVVSLHPALASWYYDAGNTACGFHAGNGVASPYLPCGTKVTFAYHGRAVTAVVDDRGPFVPGRTFDLNQNTAAALGFGGVDTVWTSI